MPRTSAVLGPMRDVLLRWGMGTVGLYLLTYLLPEVWNAWFRMAYLVSGVTWCLFAYTMTRHSLRLCLPIVLLLILQLWSFVTMVNSWVALGRPPSFGRAELWILEILMPFFITSCLVYIEPSARNWILKAFFVGFSVSCAVGLLQFFRVPGFYELGQNFYAQKDMDFWDGKPGLRAVGLTRHPYLLCFQALTCFAMVAAPLVYRKARKWDIPLLFFFSAVVICSQARSLYLVLAILWPIVGILMIRRDAVGTLKAACIGVSILIAGFMLAPSRLGYALSDIAEGSSYSFRVESRWTQSDQIFKDQPVMGIGPSNILFLGDGIPDRYTENMNLMESGYRVFLAMYGLPGMLLLIFGLVATIAVCASIAANKAESDERRAMGFLGLALTISIAVNSYSANTFDQYMIVPASILLSGVMLRTRAETAAAKKKTPILRTEPLTPAVAPEPMAKLRALL